MQKKMKKFKKIKNEKNLVDKSEETEVGKNEGKDDDL